MSGRRQDQVGLGTRLIYGSGAIAFGVKDHGFSYFLLIFYNQVMGLPAAKVGLAIMIALIADAALDPLIGQASDNLRTRWGRRHPFMYAAAIPAGVSFILLWNPPRGWDDPALFAYLVTVAVLIRSFINCYEVPSAAMAAELTSDYDERTRLFGYRYLFGWIGGLIMYVSALWLFLRPDEAHPVGQLNPAGYARYGFAAAGLMIASILFSALGTHRRIRSFPLPPRREMSLRTFLGDMVGVLRNRSFVMLLLGCLFNSTGLAFWLSTTLYFQTFFWGLTSGQIALFAGSSFAAAMLAFALSQVASQRFGKKPSAIVCVTVSAAIVVAPILLRLAGLFPPNGSPLLLPLLLAQNTVSSGFGIGASILLISMVADVVEEAELRTGRRQEGLLFAAHSFVVTAVTGVGIFLSGAMLGAIGFPSGAQQGDVPPQAVRSLGLAFAPALVILHAMAGLMLTGYGISRRGHEDHLRKLAAARRGPRAVGRAG